MPGAFHYFFVFAGFSLVFFSLLQLYASSWRLNVIGVDLDGVPATIFRNPTIPAGPAIVIAHGFAGSQQLMYALANTLAQNGYVAITFDFAGHGRNSTPMAGGIKDMARSTEHLLSELRTVVRYARTVSGNAGRTAIVGHSMAAELVVQFAMKEKNIEAVAALSLFGKSVTAEQPRNLLMVTGAWEPGILRDAGLRVLRLTTSGPAEGNVTYGDIATGTARRFVLASGTEHIGVIYSHDALQETTAWLNAVFAHKGSGYLDRRGLWIGALLLGLVLLARPALMMLPRISAAIRQPVSPWSAFLAIAGVPALATPLILWKLPTDFLPILLGDYLAVHFTVYGVLTALMLRIFRQRIPDQPERPMASWRALSLTAVCVAGYQIIVMGFVIDQHVASYFPVGIRWLLVPILFVTTAVYFLADAALLRSFAGLRGGYAVTKLCFALSLAIAVGLNPAKLFFLAIIVPVICILFILYGLLGRWTLSATGEHSPAALGNALALAWSIAVTFPIVS